SAARHDSAGVEELRERRRKRDDRERPDRRGLEPERAARAEDQRLDRGDRHAERVGDLRIRSPLELAHDERRALVEGKTGERVAIDVLCVAAVEELERSGPGYSGDLRRCGRHAFSERSVPVFGYGDTCDFEYIKIRRRNEAP